MSKADLFKKISDQVSSKALSADDALKQMKDIDFNLFSIEDIQLVQQASWLPDKEAVAIMKSWMRLHDQVLLELRAFLVMTPEISRDLLIDFVKAVETPSAPPNLSIHNIFNRLATAGGSRPFKNPVKYGLIKVESNPKPPNQAVFESIFDPDMEKFFQSTPVPNPSVVFTLPPFLRVQIESYQLGTPKQNTPKKGGLQGWLLQASNNPSFTNATQIAQVTGDIRLNTSEKTEEYEADNKTAGFYRYIKLTSTSQNHTGNLALILKNFDISGKLIIAKE